jgi:SAM-dependent methyltransferase
MTTPVRNALGDALFDQQFPAFVRARSGQHLTPVAVALAVASIFHERGCRRVLDVGCGPGKFCLVAGRQHPNIHFLGIDRRERLVQIGMQLAQQRNATNVTLSVGDVTQVAWDGYDGFYFFNPFAESTFEASDRFDDEASYSVQRFGVELLRVEALLERAAPGTVVVTYHGLGGPIPASYELDGDVRGGSDRIRTWVQGSRRSAHWAWLETDVGVRRVSRSGMHSALASLVCGDTR